MCCNSPCCTGLLSHKNNLRAVGTLGLLCTVSVEPTSQICLGELNALPVAECAGSFPCLATLRLGKW